MVTRFAEVERLPELAAHALGLRSQVEQIVERYAFMDHAVVVGRGLNYANAYEFAIKLMETCYVVAERFSSADFLHGPIAMVERNFPVFLFAPPGKTLAGMKSLLSKLTRRRQKQSSYRARIKCSNPQRARSESRRITRCYRRFLTSFRRNYCGASGKAKG